MKLNEYLSKHSISAADFAKRIGVATFTVNRYLNGTRIPDRVVMPRIKAETGEQVTADSFY